MQSVVFLGLSPVSPGTTSLVLDLLFFQVTQNCCVCEFRWTQFSISIRQLCSGDWDRTLKIMVWDWNK